MANTEEYGAFPDFNEEIPDNNTGKSTAEVIPFTWKCSNDIQVTVDVAKVAQCGLMFGKSDNKLFDSESDWRKFLDYVIVDKMTPESQRFLTSILDGSNPEGKTYSEVGEALITEAMNDYSQNDSYESYMRLVKNIIALDTPRMFTKEGRSLDDLKALYEHNKDSDDNHFSAESDSFEIPGLGTIKAIKVSGIDDLSKIVETIGNIIKGLDDEDDEEDEEDERNKHRDTIIVGGLPMSLQRAIFSKRLSRSESLEELFEETFKNSLHDNIYDPIFRNDDITNRENYLDPNLDIEKCSFTKLEVVNNKLIILRAIPDNKVLESFMVAAYLDMDKKFKLIVPLATNALVNNIEKMNEAECDFANTEDIDKTVKYFGPISKILFGGNPIYYDKNDELTDPIVIDQIRLDADLCLPTNSLDECCTMPFMNFPTVRFLDAFEPFDRSDENPPRLSYNRKMIYFGTVVMDRTKEIQQYCKDFDIYDHDLPIYLKISTKIDDIFNYRIISKYISMFVKNNLAAYSNLEVKTGIDNNNKKYLYIEI